MILGITLFGVITAHVAAFFVEAQKDDMPAAVQELTAELARLQRSLTDLLPRESPSDTIENDSASLCGSFDRAQSAIELSSAADSSRRSEPTPIGRE